MIRLLAYQYRDLHDQDYDVEQRDKFVRFVEQRLGFPEGRLLSKDSKKLIKFSYPDLYYHEPPPEKKEALLHEFDGKFSGVKLTNIYVIYVKQNAPHIGFTASVVFEMELEDSSGGSLKQVFVPHDHDRSRFHQDFQRAWEAVADKRKTLPVVLFFNDVNESVLWDIPESSSERIFGAPAPAVLPSGRVVRLERGFPYVSYVISADIDAVMPEEIHRCDFAMLMALPGFVEGKLESVGGYREELIEVQDALENGNFEDAQKKYNQAWRGFEKVQGLAPTTTAAVQRILQKYPGNTIFALIAKDNSQLIEFTVNAAIAAADQVRSNIQSFAQQKLQEGYNDLQRKLIDLTASTRNLQKESVDLTRSIRRVGFWTGVAGGAAAAATLVLAIGSGWTIWIAYNYSPSTRTQIVGPKGEPTPIRVIAEPTLPRSSERPSILKIMAVFKRIPNETKAYVTLISSKNTNELAGEISIPPVISSGSPIEVAIIQSDGSVVAKNSIIMERTPFAIRLVPDKGMFAEGQQYYVQASQSPIWTIKLPIKILAK